MSHNAVDESSIGNHMEIYLFHEEKVMNEPQVDRL